MKYGLLFFSAMTLLCAGCFEKTAPGDVPSAFFYKGKPVDPYCLTPGIADVGNNSVSLDVCSGKTKKPPAYQENHFYGVEVDDQSGSMTNPYTYYKYLGMQGDNHVIQVIYSSGGTGQFSDVRIVSLDGNLLHTVSSAAGGDRCNGGIASASVTDGLISYSQNITPFDLIQMSNGNQAGFKAYDDIQACAACCVGTANYEGGTRKSVTLTQDPKSEVPEDLGPKDACFYGTYNETYKAGTALDAQKLRKFGETFNERCAQLKD